MNKNIIIGLGGTGSRAIEAALVLLAAGHGPVDPAEGVFLGIVDQDSQNGNAVRAEDLFKRLREVQHRFRAEKVAFTRTPVAPFTADVIEEGSRDPIVMKPDVDDRPLATLLDILHLSDQHRSLFEHLFAADETKRPPTIGYQGRAHVGAAATYLTMSDSALESRLEKIVDAGRSGNQPVKIVLIGSAFGGTGASGFPTLARKLAEFRAARDGAEKADVEVGGVLLLPYFNFQDPEGEDYALRSAELLTNTRQALEFYADLLEEEPGIFDRLYLVGWNDLFALLYNKRGGPDQRNPPLPPDLYAAVAAMDFIAGGADTVQAGNRRDRYADPLLSGRGQPHHVTWTDVPHREVVLQRLAALLRLALYARYSLVPALGADGSSSWRELVHLGAPGALENERERWQLLTNEGCDGLFDLILKWAGGMQAFGGDFGLWNGGFARVDPDAPQKEVELLSAVDLPRTFDDLFAVDGRRRLHQVYADLCDPRTWWTHKAQRGPNSLVAVAEHVARLRDGG